MTNYANPDSVGAPFHLYSQVSVAGDLVSVAGQVGVDRDNQVVGPDVTSQALQTYENIRLILESQGATLRDVVRFVVYLVDADDVAGFYAAREQYFGAHFAEGEYPPNTLLIVQGARKAGVADRDRRDSAVGLDIALEHGGESAPSSKTRLPVIRSWMDRWMPRPGTCTRGAVVFDDSNMRRQPRIGVALDATAFQARQYQ
jgi:enamine deaminase RidA (YjgF/YER057c/UK114 family)